MHRVVWSAQQWKALRQHFEAAKHRETGAFLLLAGGGTSQGARLLVREVLLPPEGGLEVQGHDALRPSGQWLSGVIGVAIQNQLGLGFIHSHPNPSHPPFLSALDWQTSITWSRSIGPMLDGCFASLVWSPRGVTGVMFKKSDAGSPIELDRIDSLGEGTIQPLHPTDNESQDEALDDRQIRAITALGNKRIRELHVAVVGAGGTGSPLAEQLARLGVARLVLVDPDVIDDVSNIRRVVGSRPSDVGAMKAEVVGRHLRSLQLACSVEIVCDDVRREGVMRQLLDCDVVFNTTDTQSSRAFLNQAAYQYYLPLIDIGVRIGTTLSGDVSGMPVELRVLLPDNGCLWCRKVLSSQAIYEENLPRLARDKLAAEGYVQALPGHQPSLIPVNYFAAAIAATSALHLYSGQPLISSSIIFDAWGQYAHPLETKVDPTCICQEWRGQGDAAPLAFLPR
jgi:molybdopterin-synthase adenylyltransferase